MKNDIYGNNKGDALPVNVDEKGNLIVSPMSLTTMHHENTTIPSYGEIANIDGLKIITVAAYGTGNANINFQVSIDGVNWYQKCCFYSYSEVNGFGYIDDITIAGWKYARCEVASITGGNVNIISNAIY